MSTEEEPEIVFHPEITEWRIDKESPGLEKDLKETGQLHNIVFRKLTDRRLQLLAGELRYRNLRKLGKSLDEMDIKVLENVSDKEALLIAASENRFRKKLSAVEEGRMFQSLTKTANMSIDEITFRYHCSETYIRTRLNLLDLPLEIQDMVDKGDIPMSYAQPIKRLEKVGKTAQMELVKQIKKGQREEWGGISSVEQAEDFVEKTIAKFEHRKELVKKYGPCPKCGSKKIGETWTEEKLACEACGFAWHKETKDPWKFYELKQKAKEMGLELKIGEEGAELTAKDVTELMKEIEMQKRKQHLPKTLRSKHTIYELLEPFITAKNLLRFKMEGDKVTIKLIEDSKLHFTARRHNYKSGEKTQVTPRTPWGEDKEIAVKRVLKFLETLEVA